MITLFRWSMAQISTYFAGMGNVFLLNVVWDVLFLNLIKYCFIIGEATTHIYLNRFALPNLIKTFLLYTSFASAKENIYDQSDSWSTIPLYNVDILINSLRIRNVEEYMRGRKRRHLFETETNVIKSITLLTTCLFSIYFSI